MTMRGLTARLALCVSVLAVISWAMPTGAQVPEPESAPVKVANRTIIVLRGPIAGYHASERVAGTLERIERALDAERLPAVSTEDTPDGTQVLLGGKPAFLVTRIDINSEIGETTAAVAREAAKRLQVAILERREQARPSYVARALALALGATLVFALLVWLITRSYRWAARRMTLAAAAQSEKLKVSGVQLLRAEHLLTAARSLIGAVVWLIGLLLTWAWLSYVLERLPYTRPLGEQLAHDLLAALGQAGLAVVEALPGVLLVLVVFLVTRGVVRIANVFFDRVEEGQLQFGRLDAHTARPTRRIVTVVIWFFALGMAYPYLPGAQTGAFKGLSVLVGLMVSLGAASLVGQAFSGLILMYSGAFHVGDYVRVSGAEGTVVEVGMFVTRIRTGLGEEVTVPSSTMMSNATTNYSRAMKGTGYLVDTSVTIGYATPWRQVHAMLEEAARRVTGIARDPKPFVRETALSDYYVEYRLIAYTPAEHRRVRVDVLSDLHGAIQDVFNEYGVQIMSPHYVSDPKQPQVVPKAQWHAAPAKPPDSSEA
jgi:small-conductance mechanosensitive channel